MGEDRTLLHVLRKGKRKEVANKKRAREGTVS